MSVKYYSVHVIPGRENKVRDLLLGRAIAHKAWQDTIFDIIIPTQKEYVTRNGKRKIVDKKIFPGYIFLKMYLDEDSEKLVQGTDGVSGCSLFVRTDTDGIPLKKTNKNKKCSEEVNTDYIEKTELTDELKSMKVVCADPNYSDLIYCGAKDKNGNLQTFRYTQNQRRLETRLKKYNKIMDKINKETKIQDHTIKEIETTLSNYNSKTCNYNKFMEYCIEKNKINYKLYNHYEQRLFRKLKFL